jgi:hypothetical protein
MLKAENAENNDIIQIINRFVSKNQIYSPALSRVR